MGAVVSQDGQRNLPPWWHQASPRPGLEEHWNNLMTIFKETAQGDTHSPPNLSSLCRIVEMHGFWGMASPDACKHANKAGFEGCALLNWQTYFGNMPVDHLSKKDGYHPGSVLDVLGISPSIEHRVAFSNDNDRNARIVLELPQEMEVSEVGWTFTPWDRNNCTRFVVTTTNASGNHTQWDEISVPRTTADQVIRSVFHKTGFDISRAIGDIEPAVRASRDVYKMALKIVMERNGQDMERAKDLRDETYTDDQAMLLQPTNNLAEIYEDAAYAQRWVKSIIAGGTEWAETEINEAWKLEYNRQHGAGAHRNFRSIKAHSTIAGLQIVVDPGLKSHERAEAKAKYKYRDPKNKDRIIWQRLRDVSRFALEFDTPAAMLAGIAKIESTFTVLQRENRFRQPTALGWSDISFLLDVKVPTARGRHITELQCYLTDFAKARDKAHEYYETIRSTLPNVCRVPIKDLDHVQYIVNEELVEGAQVHRGQGCGGKYYMSTTMARQLGRPASAKFITIDFMDVGNSGYGGQRIVFLHVFGPQPKH